ncbi:MAG: SGNH/GDSL hydrolase family protein [Alistipes sp.]|nr:SGNH/GDSL hydrolase family protein [Alistipes sp.]
MRKLAIVIALLCLVLPTMAKPKAEIKSQWRGVRVAYLGDSITDKSQIEKGQNETYWSYLEKMLGTVSYVYGISGHRWSQIPGQTNKLIAEHGQEVDAIMIFVGTNDYNANVPLGEWFTEEVVEVEVSGPKGSKSGVMAERKKRTLVMDDKTVRGRINIAMSQLKREYPTKQIILLTPIHRGDALLSDRNIQPNELYANGVGEYIDAYVEVVKEAGNVWAVPVIDLNSICGLYPLEETNALYWRRPSLEKSKKTGKNRIDRLHPNSAGHLRMARALAYQLLGYPAKLD